MGEYNEVDAMSFDAGNSTANMDADWDTVEDTVDFPVEESSEDSGEDGAEVNSELSEDNNENEENSSELGEETSLEDAEESTEANEENEEVKDEKGEEEEKEEGEESEESEESVSYEDYKKSIEEGTYSEEIDGEEVSLQDMRNSFKGHKEVDKRFTELDNSKKEYQQELDSVNSYINEFSNKMQSGDVVGAFSYFGQFANIPPYMIKEQLIAALTPEMERRSALTSSEIQNEMLQEQNKYLQDRNESESKRRESEQANEELTQSINSARETHSIGEEEWSEAVSFLEKHPEVENVSVDLVQDYVVNSRAYDKAESILTEMEVNLDNENLIDNFQSIIVKNPSFDDNDLKEIITNTVKANEQNSAKKQIEKRIKKSEPKGKVKQEKKQEASQNNSETYGSLEDEWDAIG